MRVFAMKVIGTFGFIDCFPNIYSIKTPQANCSEEMTSIILVK